MATLSDYMSGTISLANGSVTVTGTGTLFEVTRFREGDTLQIQNLTAVIASVDSDTQLTLAEPWTGASIVNGAYRARQLGDGSRVSTQAATVIELLGNGVLANLAELGVEEGKVPVGGPTGEYELTDLVTDPNGNLAELAALTLAARQILQTDAEGALKAVALAANKFLRTDANGDVTLSDIQAWATSMLGLVGAENKFPYLNAANTAALADITPFARNILDDANGSSVWTTLGGSSSDTIIRFPNGIILQRGWNTLPAVGYGTLAFPTAFPTGCFGMVASIAEDPGGSYTYTIVARAGSATSFYGTGHTIFATSIVLAAVSFQWIAWGV
ncbi:gp53-like domain-containing protein [Ochrobactrum soli]|uniref:gp53-like domain-containing protein n=1 Tax=Ochrobactrum soli TaxID=2448455 RepID=UPI001AEEEDBD|nr:hypothetical protein [[Ochrobactrum] soli]